MFLLIRLLSSFCFVLVLLLLVNWMEVFLILGFWVIFCIFSVKKCEVENLELVFGCILFLEGVIKLVWVGDDEGWCRLCDNFCLWDGFYSLCFFLVFFFGFIVVVVGVVVGIGEGVGGGVGLGVGVVFLGKGEVLVLVYCVVCCLVLVLVIDLLWVLVLCFRGVFFVECVFEFRLEFVVVWELGFLVFYYCIDIWVLILLIFLSVIVWLLGFDGRLFWKNEGFIFCFLFLEVFWLWILCSMLNLCLCMKLLWCLCLIIFLSICLEYEFLWLVLLFLFLLKLFVGLWMKCMICDSRLLGVELFLFVMGVMGIVVRR